MNNLEERLTEAGVKRDRAEAMRHDASLTLRSYVRQAAAEGWTKTRIGEVAGISRQTVHSMLRQ